MPLVERIEPGPDTIRVLLTTDNHVGAFENDPIRGDDAWKTFDEITTIAKDRDVDMVIQGGDLFHINKPTKKSMYHVMKSLRANCMGDRPCELELLSDPTQSLNNGFDEVNYEDPNLNISIPVFAISGNHDDATGESLLSALDVLAVTGLINNFGKVKNTEAITVSPILLQKGVTKLALYGMSNVRDERLHRLFRDGGVKFQRPNLQTEDWFNLFVIHQNHAAHTYTSSIPESFLPNFLDFVLWGHEHECIPHPVHNPETTFDVLQAGSSVATSLAEGEVADKKVFILNIRGKDYSIEPVELKTVRPFVLREIVLSKTDLIPGAASKADVIAYLTDEVEKAIKRANKHFNSQNSFDSNRSINLSEMPLPLIRLRVEYSGGYEIENVTRFSNRFVGKIANVNDVVQFYKKKAISRTDTKLSRKTKFDVDLIEENLHHKKSTELELQDIIRDFLQQTQLTLVPEIEMNHAVKKFVENDDKQALNQFINQEIKRETKMLLDIDIDENEFHGTDEKQAKTTFKHVLSQLKNINGPINVDYEPELEPTNNNNNNKKYVSTRKKRDTTTKRKKSTATKRTTKKSKSDDMIISSDDSDDYGNDNEEEEEEDYDDDDGQDSGIRLFVTDTPDINNTRRSKSNRVKRPTSYVEDESGILSDEDDYVPPSKTKEKTFRRKRI
ncbi:manganese-dependent, structurally specific endonuclease/3'-5' exonuclease, putative [Candida dubliniensis CD36]|uniref:Double-strand break repair protein n=1 Tax=Candida dubliniensis (strain CD36 / ATCC MYA-646 / CBS 7987 / NCPF 3949 / NRRL Y-17841) TaxID=573826 RepID=B9WK20_CANDC|nr:manganese-dependent, structurally specific endonuclease/3'-5' exonuclease, putative [Candida dubliniensis CD36]CAX40671.1 manganese-dependent, structurally specific endonuclease/3'-5' exonuclease, putative [Candida dubliniensis CD36]